MSDHYIANGLEVYDLIARYGLDFTAGNILKYVFRAGRKPSETYESDMAKARHYDELRHRTLPLFADFDAFCAAFKLNDEQKKMAIQAICGSSGTSFGS